VTDSTEVLPILRVTRQSSEANEDLVTREQPLTIILNNEELVTLLCSPKDLEQLAIGFLSSEGLLKSKDELRKIVVDEQRGIVRIETKDTERIREPLFKRLITSGCGRGASFYSLADVQGQAKVASQLRISAVSVFTLVKQFQRNSQIYRKTGGVHSAALCDASNILVFNEDIGRHNAIDKILGKCLLDSIPTDDGIIITSGRISSEILLKVAKRNIPILVSKSAPTNLGVRLANTLRVTLVGFVRGERMNVYATEWRIVTDEKQA
jgi:FdhD protein